MRGAEGCFCHAMPGSRTLELWECTFAAAAAAFADEFMGASLQQRAEERQQIAMEARAPIPLPEYDKRVSFWSSGFGSRVSGCLCQKHAIARGAGIRLRCCIMHGRAWLHKCLGRDDATWPSGSFGTSRIGKSMQRWTGERREKRESGRFAKS